MKKSELMLTVLPVFIVILKQENVITSGNMVQDLADLVQKSTMTEVKSTVAENRIVRLVVNVTVSWKYGTMYLPSLKEMVTVVIPSFLRKTLIPVWAWSVWQL